MNDQLSEGYRRARALTRLYGTTYFWGARLLPPAQRRDVYAVYALCRLADDIVDEPDKVEALHPASHTLAMDHDAPQARLAAFRTRFFDALAHGDTDDPVLRAVCHSVRARGTDPECFERFFDAMALDLTHTTWASWDELRDGYMEGSAAVIGEMMLPVLEPLTPEAKSPARALGLAFQLTNFLRDVVEDLDRGRIYLPQDELAAYGADPRLGRVDQAWREFMAAQVARNRALYRHGRDGLAMLPPASRCCVGTALVLYARILDRIEEAGYDVFSGRIRVPTMEKAMVFARAKATGRPPRVNLIGMRRS